MIRGETRTPPAPPVSARTAALRVELSQAPPIRHRARRRRPRIAWRAIGTLFLPHAVLLAIILAVALTLKGTSA